MSKIIGKKPMRRKHKSMDEESRFQELVAIFERTRPAIERGLNSMQSHSQQRAKQIWQELVSMIEDKEDDIEKFASKLDEFNQQITEYQARAKVLASNAKMDVI